MSEKSCTPPTDEQLVNFMVATCRADFKAVAKRNIPRLAAKAAARSALRNPIVRAHWEERHRRMQEAAGRLSEPENAREE